MTPTRVRGALVAAATAFAVLGAPLPASAGQDPWCGIHWGSLPEATADATRPTGQVADVRAGQHPCFDRLVVDLREGDAAGFDVRYVAEVGAQGSGAPVPVEGGAVLQVVVRAPAYDESRGATYLPADPARVVDVGGARTLEQVAWAGSFEGQTSLAVGTRARLPFRVFVLDGAPGSPDGARVVVDVAHHW